jgi:pimeloyl-ACP methyl ester carboxylesterase
MKSPLNLLLLSSTLLLLSCGDRKPDAEDAKTETTIKETVDLAINGVPISYKTYGDGAFTLLFVHGWCINQTYWSNQIESLKSGYKIVTIDLPGFGDSKKNGDSYSIQEYGEDVSEVIEQLNLKNVVLIGHSMGGDIILESALKNPEVIALVGIDNFKDAGIEYDDNTQAEINGFLDMLKRNFSEIAPAYAEGMLFHPSTDSLVKSRVMNDFRKSDSTAAILSLEALFEYAPIEARQLSGLKQKLYLINSDASPTNTNGLDATGIAYEVVDINATGHYPMIEKPEEFNQLLKQTLEKIVSTQE